MTTFTRKMVPVDTDNVIEAEGLTTRFGDVQALAGLDLTAPSGGVIAVRAVWWCVVIVAVFAPLAARRFARS